MAQFSSLCKESSQGQNVLGYLFKVHTFARFKFTCSMKSSFMELMLCLSLSLKLEKKKKQINNHAFVHSLVLTSNTANNKLVCVFLFSLWIWQEIILNFIVLFHYPMMTNNKQKIKSSKLVCLLEPQSMKYPKNLN